MTMTLCAMERDGSYPAWHLMRVRRAMMIVENENGTDDRQRAHQHDPGKIASFVYAHTGRPVIRHVVRPVYQGRLLNIQGPPSTYTASCGVTHC